MIQLQQRISAFNRLGDFLRNINSENPDYKLLFDTVSRAKDNNGWFSKENVLHALNAWGNLLNKKDLIQWTKDYVFENEELKIVGLVLAGNIPLVGFHDFLTVLITGNDVLVKTGSKDQYLVKFLAQYLIQLDERFLSKITFVEGKLEGFDAIIATGSNNTSRYFDYYFKNVPNIIRKNRNSVAVLTGNESKEDLVHLGEDIFRYFGLGCRNVSKLFVPKGYDFKVFFDAIYAYKDVIFYEKYANNYDYNKAVFLMSLYKLLDNEFLTLKEDSSYSSPISSVFYEFYDDIEQVKKRLKDDESFIQCVVSKNLIEKSISFGETQKPALWDYADNLDTIDFLNSI